MIISHSRQHLTTTNHSYLSSTSTTTNMNNTMLPYTEDKDPPQKNNTFILGGIGILLIALAAGIIGLKKQTTTSNTAPNIRDKKYKVPNGSSDPNQPKTSSTQHQTQVPNTQTNKSDPIPPTKAIDKSLHDDQDFNKLEKAVEIERNALWNEYQKPLSEPLIVGQMPQAYQRAGITLETIHKFLLERNDYIYRMILAHSHVDFPRMNRQEYKANGMTLNPLRGPRGGFAWLYSLQIDTLPNNPLVLKVFHEAPSADYRNYTRHGNIAETAFGQYINQFNYVDVVRHLGSYMPRGYSNEPNWMINELIPSGVNPIEARNPRNRGSLCEIDGMSAYDYFIAQDTRNETRSLAWAFPQIDQGKFNNQVSEVLVDLGGIGER